MTKHISVREMDRLITARIRNKRGVAETISTLLLLSITVVGAVLIFVLFQGTNVTSLAGSLNTQQADISSSIQIIGYDTRDGTGLSGLTGLLDNNATHNKLCTTSCVAANRLPANGGTDFIILKIKNIGTNTINLNSISINEKSHKWDSTTADVFLTVSESTPGSFPNDGKFSIIDPTINSPTPKQLKSTQLFANQEVRLVIKLSSSISPDISLTQQIRIVFPTSSANAQNTILIPSGDAG